MLEKLAFSYVEYETLQIVIGIVVVILGFALGMRQQRVSQGPMARGPYILATLALLSLAGIVPGLWLWQASAILGGVLWLLAVMVLGLIFVIGIFLGRIAHARSIDAFGNGSQAWLALIPLVNLVLFFRAPQEPRPIRWGSVVLTVVGAVLLLVVSGAIRGKINYEVMTLEWREAREPARLAAVTKRTREVMGMEYVIRSFASGGPPLRFQGDIVVNDRTITDSALTYHYLVWMNADVFSSEWPELEEKFKGATCWSPRYRVLLQEGVTFGHVFYVWNADRRVIEQVEITQAVCDEMPGRLPVWAASLQGEEPSDRDYDFGVADMRGPERQGANPARPQQ